MTAVGKLFRKHKAGTGLVLLAALLIAGIAQWNGQTPTPSGASPRPAETRPQPAPASTPSHNLSDLLAQLKVVDEPRDRADYDRDCGQNDACHFGPSWTDDTTAPGSHNGCDTRNDVLNAQLVQITHKPGSRNCVVTSGTLHDQYTGKTINFVRGEKSSPAVQIDHIYPLKRAWDFGAFAWPQTKREAFANDIDLNLVAVDGPTNQAKGASGPSQWMPSVASERCDYAHKYLTVAVKYDLAVSGADRDAAVAACP